MKKLVIITFLVMILVAPLFAQAVVEAEKEEEKIHLTFVEVMPSEERTLILKAAIRNYEAQHPNIDVEIVSLDTDTAENALYDMIKEGKSVDVCEVRDQSVSKLINAGMLLPINDYLMESNIADELVDGAFIGTSTFGGTNYYFIAQCLYVKALGVRTDILEEYGIEIPTTMEELFEACIKISSQGKGQYGLAIKGTNPLRILDPLLFAEIENIDSNNVYLTTDGQFYLDTPSGRAALENYKSLYKYGSPAESAYWSFSDQVEGFTSGECAFIIQDPDVLPAFENELDEDQYTIVAVPVGSTGKRYLDYGFIGLSVSSNSEHPDEAFDFIKYMISAEVNAQLCDFYGALPINTEAYKLSTVFDRDVYKAGISQLTAEDTVIFSFPLQDERFQGYMKLFTTAIRDMILENTTVDETIQILKAYWGY
jgi:multiple sugar transport system substrate-binding protein